MIPKTDCAIWDLALYKTTSGVYPIIAEDSGKVKMIDPRNNYHTITLTVTPIQTLNLYYRKDLENLLCA